MLKSPEPESPVLAISASQRSDRFKCLGDLRGLQAHLDKASRSRYPPSVLAFLLACDSHTVDEAVLWLEVSRTCQVYTSAIWSSVPATMKSMPVWSQARCSPKETPFFLALWTYFNHHSFIPRFSGLVPPHAATNAAARALVSSLFCAGFFSF